MSEARIAATVAGLTMLALGLAATPASADGLNFACGPPLPRLPAQCSAWNTRSVELVWDWDSINFEPAPVPGSDCTTPHTFDKDTAGTDVMCAVWRSDNHQGLTNATATIRIDRTAPTVTGFTSGRPPDHDGWWTHPVTLSFTGTDATSGIAACDVVDYSGPDSDGGPVSGGCRDVAGNSAVGAFPINYDSTPPALAPAASKAVRGRNIVDWTVSNDALETRVLRSPGIGNAAVSEVYVGRGHTFSDTSVKAGKRYTYSLTAPDEAGNTASTAIALTAWPDPQASPAATGARRLRWKSVKRASYYNVQLFRGGQKILSAWPRSSELQLRRRWSFGGRRYSMSPGTYHWYVWPGYGPRSRHHYGKLIMHRHFTVAGRTKSG